MSDSDQISLAYKVESNFGVIPTGNPTLQALRFTNESFAQATIMTPSSEIRSDRQVADVIRTHADAAGDINFELSYSAYDEFLMRALLSSAWSTQVSETRITYSMADGDNSVNDSASGFVAAGYTANQWVKISGFTEAANNGYFKIVSVIAGKMVLSGGTITTEAAGDSVTIQMGPQIINGTTTTGASYSIEKEFTDLSNIFEVVSGLMVNTLSLNLASEAIITGSFGFMGKVAVSAAATFGDGSNTAAPTNAVMSCVDDVTSVLEGQASYDVVAANFVLNNNLRNRLQVSTLGPISIGAGVCGVTGTLQSYFTTIAVMDKYLNNTSSTLAFIIEDAAGNGYIVDFPNVKYGDGKRIAGGQNQDIIADMAFSAFRNSSEDVTIRIARFPI